jgi:hypothetical protein
LSAVQKSVELNGQPTSSDQFLLAAIHRGRGDNSQAQHWYDQAVSRLKHQESVDRDGASEDVRRQLREETERVLLISK